MGETKKKYANNFIPGVIGERERTFLRAASNINFQRIFLVLNVGN